MNDNEKLNELEEKIAKFKKQEEKPVVNPNNSGHSLAARVITDLASGLLVGGVIGYFLDKAFDSSPLCLVIFLFVGIAAGFMNLYRSLDKDVKSDE